MPDTLKIILDAVGGKPLKPWQVKALTKENLVEIITDLQYALNVESRRAEEFEAMLKEAEIL